MLDNSSPRECWQDLPQVQVPPLRRRSFISRLLGRRRECLRPVWKNRYAPACGNGSRARTHPARRVSDTDGSYQAFAAFVPRRNETRSRAWDRQTS